MSFKDSTKKFAPRPCMVQPHGELLHPHDKINQKFIQKKYDRVTCGDDVILFIEHKMSIIYK